MTFIVEGKPKGKERARFSGTHTYTPATTKAYMDAVRTAFLLARGKKSDKALCVTINLYIPIPASFNKKEKADAVSGVLIPINKPDNDNAEKVIFDALNGFAWYDDTQVIENHTYKHYAERPCAVVEITDAGSLYYKANGKGKYIRRSDI